MTYTNNMKHIGHSICHEDVIDELSKPLDSKFILKPSQKNILII